MIPAFPPSEDLTPDSKATLRMAIQAHKNAPKRSHRVSELVRSLNPEIVFKAASELSAGIDFKYPDSRKFDVVMLDGTRLAPKAVIGYSGQLQYGAPLLPEDFSGGDESFAFGRLNKAGLVVLLKHEDATGEGEKFRKEVSRLKKSGLKSRPEGKASPNRKTSVCYTFERLAVVVAYVENRAKGFCELCGNAAPFLRANGEPFLEVHHITPLSEDGADAVENAAALCPNCHRESHHGKNAPSLREVLAKKIQ